jgi:hypothetical protein
MTGLSPTRRRSPLADVVALPLLTALLIAVTACGGDDVSVVGSGNDTAVPVTTTPGATDVSTTPPATDAAVTTAPTEAPTTLATTTAPATGVPQPGDALVMLDLGDESSGESGAGEMVLLAPDGTTTTLWEEPVAWAVTVLDSSVDATHVLLRRSTDPFDWEATELAIVERDLSTGTETEIMRVDADTEYPSAWYLTDDEVIVMIEDRMSQDGGHRLERWSTDGQLLAAFPDPLPGWEADVLPAPDGTAVVVGDETGMRLLDVDGGVLSTFDLDGICRPVRWADDGQVLAACRDPQQEAEGYYVSQLWLADPGGGPATQLTDIVVDTVVDFGAIDLWTLPDGTPYVQRVGDCGAVWVERLLPDGTTVDLPTDLGLGPEEWVPSGWVLATGEQGLLQHLSATCEGTGGSIEWLDPTTGEAVPLLASDPGLVGIRDVRALG